MQDIVDQQLPVPHREMLPITLEEQLICFADKFFSKTHLDEEKSVEKARHSIAKYGEEGQMCIRDRAEVLLPAKIHYPAFIRKFSKHYFYKIKSWGVANKSGEICLGEEHVVSLYGRSAAFLLLEIIDVYKRQVP